MKYRKFGNLDWEVSILGFGVMSLPLTGDNPDEFNEPEIVQMIRYAIDHGVNYLDLGYPYDLPRHERRTRIIGRALKDGYRQRVRIAASIPLFHTRSSSDFAFHLNWQLEWLETEGVDFYLLGWLNRENWPGLKELGVLPLAERAMTDGRVGRLGFSYHDDFQGLRTILGDCDGWSLCQFQYSYMDVNHHPGTGGIKYAADRGLAVVITEPLRGGRLAKRQPEPVAKVWAEDVSGRSLPEWGLGWVWNHPEVSVAVSDMSSMGQVEENISLAGRAEPDSFSVREMVLINHVREAYHRLRPVPCTACRACMPCPEGIDVPRIFEIYNDAVIYDDIRTGRTIYSREHHNLDDCTECGICENACAKGLHVTDYLKKARPMLTGEEE